MNSLEKHVKALINAIDTTPDREGLQNTPMRFVSFLREFTSPQKFEPTLFENEGYDEMVIQRAIPFYSLCEHHLLPFFGLGTIAYVPDKKIIGLSKLPRMLEYFSRSLQNQERITCQVADYLHTITQSKGVGVILQARHMCMEMRGIRKTEVQTTTSALRGCFASNGETRMEFLCLENFSK